MHRQAYAIRSFSGVSRLLPEPGQRHIIVDGVVLRERPVLRGFVDDHRVGQRPCGLDSAQLGEIQVNQRSPLSRPVTGFHS